MKGALEHVFGTLDLVGRRVAIQGAGNVGFNLAKLITKAGGEVVVADVRAESAERAARELGATVVAGDAIYDQDCDVFAPCAMGATISDQTISRLKARIVCGAANNQLASADAGTLLRERGIAYAPDYVVNAGGIINAFGDFTGHYDVEDVTRKVDAIGETVSEILKSAEESGRRSHEVADAMAEAILAAARQQSTHRKP
jgi:leucine dehydrogenase